NTASFYPLLRLIAGDRACTRVEHPGQRPIALAVGPHGNSAAALATRALFLLPSRYQDASRSGDT
ncbi:MAG: hypothetical protein QF659_09875, partial [Dehalococcoidia bacterium]|nr:hypothetical protein [Dehalococcoidia bacterium]